MIRERESREFLRGMNVFKIFIYSFIYGSRYHNISCYLNNGSLSSN
uniref:Uncharacterized protein n=1 Tax=Rhizophora mucronata TaxID=61149 RepID=A0A2P2J7Q5_RHIMU